MPGNIEKEIIISIIVPVYNVEKYIHRCLDSIINQTFKKWECILVDDGSPDRSGEICDEYALKDGRFKVIHKENEGLSSARNEGLKVINGQYITFVDSDDWLTIDALEYLKELLEKNDADFAIAENIRVKNNDVPQFDVKIPSEKLLSKKDFLKMLFKIGAQANVMFAWAKLYKSSFAQVLHYPEGLTCEDVPATFEAALASEKIAYSSKYIYYYYVNPEGITEHKFSEKRFDLLKIWDLVVERAERTNDQWIIENAYINRYRADFGILCNFYMSNLTDEQRKNYIEKIESSRVALKIHKKTLLKASIPLSRKIVIIGFCNFYWITRQLLRFVSKR